MYCAKCGKKLEENQKFCSGCGQPVKEVKQAENNRQNKSQMKKEKFEYLIDKYNVHLIVNNKYGCMNNLYSLYLAKDFIHNSYNNTSHNIICSAFPVFQK